MTWVYLIGDTEAKTVKVGITGNLLARVKGVNSEQHTADEFVFLAAISTTEARLAERAILRFEGFTPATRGRRTEYLEATEPLVGYLLWLRSLDFVATVPALEDGARPVEVSAWLPGPGRALRPPAEDDGGALFSRHLQLTGPLAGTAWAWMPDPLASYQDYFTPPDLVRRASEAMGGLDLDIASHRLAQARLVAEGVEIPAYFSVSNSALDPRAKWAGRCWLNPPYGDYLPWFEKADAEADAGRLEQLCWLSPMWAFSTKQAQAHMAKGSAMVVCSPTPAFFNPGDPSRTGSNQPHAIVYWGARAAEFMDAYEGVGIPCRLIRR